VLEINVTLDLAIIAATCKQFGQSYSDDFYVYRAENRGQIIATALFKIGKTDVSIVAYSGPADDPFIMDGILRAGLHYAELYGIETGILSEEFRHCHRALFVALNYPSANTFNIVNFFSKYKNCSRI